MDSQLQNKAVEEIVSRFEDISQYSEKLAFPDLHTGIFKMKDINSIERIIPRYIYFFQSSI